MFFFVQDKVESLVAVDVGRGTVPRADAVSRVAVDVLEDRATGGIPEVGDTLELNLHELALLLLVGVRLCRRLSLLGGGGGLLLGLLGGLLGLLGGLLGGRGGILLGLLRGSLGGLLLLALRGPPLLLGRLGVGRLLHDHLDGGRRGSGSARGSGLLARGLSLCLGGLRLLVGGDPLRVRLQEGDRLGDLVERGLGVSGEALLGLQVREDLEVEPRAALLAGERLLDESGDDLGLVVPLLRALADRAGGLGGGVVAVRGRGLHRGLLGTALLDDTGRGEPHLQSLEEQLGVDGRELLEGNLSDGSHVSL